MTCKTQTKREKRHLKQARNLEKYHKQYAHTKSRTRVESKKKENKNEN